LRRGADAKEALEFRGHRTYFGVRFPLGPGFCLRSVRPKALSSLSTKPGEPGGLPGLSCRRSSRSSSPTQGFLLIPAPPHLRPTLRAPLPHESDVSPVVIVAEEGIPAAVLSWREVMGQPCRHRSCDSGHDRALVRPPALIDTDGVPRIPRLLTRALPSLPRDAFAAGFEPE
jgi:hypothetical protein